MEELKKLEEEMASLNTSERHAVEIFIKDLVVVVGNHDLRINVLPKLHSSLRRYLCPKRRTAKDTAKVNSITSEWSPVNIRNVLFHRKSVPHEYYKWIDIYTWILLQKLSSFNNIDELENLLSYSLGRRMNISQKDKKHIINIYKKQFHRLDEEEKDRRLIDIARRVFAEATKTDLESLGSAT